MEAKEETEEQYYKACLPNMDLPGVGHCIDCNWWWPYTPDQLERGWRGHRCLGIPGDRDTNANMSCGQWKLREGLDGMLSLENWWEGD